MTEQTLPSLKRSIPDVVAEFEHKHASIEAALADFNAAGDALKSAATVGGTWGNTRIDTGHVYKHVLTDSLLKSAWRHIYVGLNIERICSATDKSKFEQSMESPPPFTIDNIRATFGKFILDPRGNVLRALAEVFCALDKAYKSHDKVKIGVDGLPKRVILRNVSDYGWGKDQLRNILNALAAYQGKPLVEHHEISALLKDENALLTGGKKPLGYRDEMVEIVARGVRLRRFHNGNGHLLFEHDTLKDINRALAEYYGDVLPDAKEARPAKPQASTAVAKDLQYYPTPREVVERIMSDVYPINGQRVLEPSCGCGRFMDAVRAAGAEVFGIEVDASRAAETRAKGHRVMVANFLETAPTEDYDRVVMNPPFYGRHYAKHVEHALKFLKPGGVLISILPATARYDHGFYPSGHWEDLPVGSFSESGTNINTSVLKLRKV